jgi:hypothetical protein
MEISSISSWELIIVTKGSSNNPINELNVEFGVLCVGTKVDCWSGSSILSKNLPGTLSSSSESISGNQFFTGSVISEFGVDT